jgi:hypothetical protein
VGTARFLQLLDSGQGDYTATRDSIPGNPTVDDLMGELEQRRQNGLESVMNLILQPSTILPTDRRKIDHHQFTRRGVM